MSPNERSLHASPAQVEALIDFLEQNPDLAKGYVRSQHAKERSRRRWQALSDRLNSSGGAIKDYKQWAKYWTDKKRALKQKVAARAAARRRTGGGVDDEPELSVVEERMVALCGGEGFSTGDTHLGIEPFPDTMQSLPHQVSEVLQETETLNETLQQGSPAIEEHFIVLEPNQNVLANYGRNQTARRLFVSPEKLSVARDSPTTLQSSEPGPSPSSPPPLTLSHTPTPVTPPPPAVSPSRRGTTVRTARTTSVHASPRRAGSSSSRQVEPPSLRTLSPQSVQTNSLARRGTSSSINRRSRASRVAGSSASRHMQPTVAPPPPPSQRLTEFSRLSERFLRLEERQIEVQQSNARVMQNMIDLCTARDRSLLQEVATMGNHVMEVIAQRDRVTLEAVAAVGDGLKALAVAASAFRSNMQ